MGRHYTVSYHPKRNKIESDIINGIPDREIARKYHNLNYESVRSYRLNKMPQILKHAQGEEADGLVARINDYMDTIDDLRESILNILDNPENPGHICYYPRAEEIRVKYHDKSENKDKIAKLQDLLDGVERSKERFVRGVYVDAQDPRTTLLKTADVLNRQLELLCKAKGYISDDTNVTINQSTATGNVEDIIAITREALAPYPEAKEAFVSALLAAAAEGDREEAASGHK